jgi:hypothetical protein
MSEFDGDGVLPSAPTNPSEIAQHHRIDVRTAKRLVDGKGGLVAVDRALVVAHRLMDRGKGVQDSTLVDDVIGRAVDVERLRTCLERLGEVARLVVDDAQQVQRPGNGQADLVRLRQRNRLARQRERVLGATLLVRDRGEMIERLRLEYGQSVRAGENSRLECETARLVGVVGTQAGGVVEQRADPLVRRRVDGYG